MLGDGVCQICQRIGVKVLAGLGGAALHLGEGEGKGTLGLGGSVEEIVTQQRP